MREQPRRIVIFGGGFGVLSADAGTISAAASI
jgi:hypothetical protein